MKKIFIKNNILLLVFSLIFLCTAYLFIPNLYKEKYNKPDTIETSKSSYNNEILQLSLSGMEYIGAVGKITELNLYSSVKEGYNSVGNVVYFIEFRKDGTYASNEDITLIHKGKKITGYKGKYELVREEVVKGEIKHDFRLRVNNEGVYDIVIYAEIY